MNWRKRSDFGAAEHLGGRTFFLDESVVQEQHAVGDVPGESHLVRDDDHGRAILGQFAHHGEDFVGQLGIQRRGGLVEQQHLRLHRERPCDRHALLLSAGKSRGIHVGLVFQVHPAQTLLAELLRFLARQTAHAPRRLDDVAQHSHVRPQVELLEHEAQVAPHAIDLGQRPSA